MQIHINNKLKLADARDRFEKCYPGLSLRFYKKVHDSHNESSERDRYSDQTLFGEILNKGIEGEMEIKSFYTVGQVEKVLEEKFGLFAQVFRSENGVWIQTSSTDKYTLHQEQAMSRNATVSIEPKYDDQLDEYGYL